MTPGQGVLIAIVDDDDAVRDSLALLLRLHGFATREFASGEAFLEWAGTEPADCVLLDLRMPGMSGLDVQAELVRREVGWPIVMLTAHGDVATTRAALKAGAFDFIEKPFDEARLLASIRNALNKMQQPEIDVVELEELQSRFNTLSARQRQVMELAVVGLSNKEIGSQLKISPKTVENHRAWVMERIGARNIAELVRIAMKIQGKP